MNNPFLKPITLLLLLLVAAPLARAQHTQVTIAPENPPAAPFVAPVQDGTAWSVQIKGLSQILQEKQEQKKRASPPAPREAPSRPTQREAREIESIYFNKVRREITHYNDGSQSIRFITRRFMIDTTRMGEVESHDLEQIPYRPDRFNDFHWLAQSLYAGSAVYAGKRCHVYRQTKPARAATDGTAIPERIIATAFIDRETLLPVALEDRFSIRKYTFQPGRATFVLPEEVRTAFAAQEAAAGHLDQKYSLPK